MTFNKCDTCGADGGRCGLTWIVKGREECENCYKTRRDGIISIQAELVRTDEELKKTFNILAGRKEV